MGTVGDRGDGGDIGDLGDIVLGWLTRLVVGLAVIAVLGFDVIQVGLADVQEQDQANDAATAARDSYGQHHDLRQALAAAQSSAHDANAENVVVPNSFSVQPSGAVSLQLTRPIHTVVAHYLPVDAFKSVRSGGSAAANP